MYYDDLIDRLRNATALPMIRSLTNEGADAIHDILEENKKLHAKIKKLEPPPKDIVAIESAVYDTEEIFPNCTVQIWKNSITGEVSIGWWKNEEE